MVVITFQILSGLRKGNAVRRAGEVSALALLILLWWGQGQLWGQGNPNRTSPPGASATAASDAGIQDEDDARPSTPEPETSPQASPSTPAASQRISEIQLVGLPLNGRSYNQLATLQAGVTDPSSGSSTRGGEIGRAHV